uniref:BTB domain-containing protein n=1 Tax=Rhabditophanes sp. KR3021 TaxID=114890 RepID=A0AC35TG26_9BILA
MGSERGYLTVGFESDNLSNNICFNEEDDTLADIENPEGDVNTLLLAPKRQRSAVSFRDDETDGYDIEQLNSKDEHLLSLHNPKLKNALMGRLNTFRKNRELCDVAIFIKEREFLAHKIVLASLSPALLDMFSKNEETFHITSIGSIRQMAPLNKNGTSDVLPSVNRNGQASNLKHLTYYEFANCDLESFQAIMDYAYTSSFDITSSKVADLYRTAYALQIRPLVKSCAKYLAQNVSISNCIGFRRQANFSSDKYLGSKVDQFLAANLGKVIDNSNEFTRLPLVKLRIIVDIEQLKKSVCEGNLVEKALKYFQELPKNTDKIESAIEMLADKVHLLYYEEDQNLQDCSKLDDLSSVGGSEIVQEYKRTTNQKSQSLPFSKENGTVHHINGACIVKTNGSIIQNNKFNSNESLNSLASSQSEVEDEIESKLIAVHKVSSECFIALTILYRRLVVLTIQVTENDEITKSTSNIALNCGGSTGMHSSLNSESGSTDSIHDEAIKQAHKDEFVKKMIDPNAAAIKVPLPAMSTPRCASGASYLNGKIIVCGGYNKGECLKIVEEYDLQTGVWAKLKCMNHERGRFDSAVVDGKVYSIGGSSGSNDIKTCEVLDPSKNQWKMIKSLSSPRSQNGCAVVDNRIFCIGGIRDQTVLRDCERYDCDENEWVTIAPLSVARCQAACITWRGLVIAVGGTDRWNCMDSVEAYDHKTNSWKNLASLKAPRRGAAIAVWNDMLYVIGGHDGNQSLASSEILESPTGKWRQGPVLTSPRANTRAVVAETKIFVIGGFNGTTFMNTMEILDSEISGFRTWKQDKIEEDFSSQSSRKSSSEIQECDEPLDSEITPRASDVNLQATVAH